MALAVCDDPALPDFSPNRLPRHREGSESDTQCRSPGRRRVPTGWLTSRKKAIAAQRNPGLPGLRHRRQTQIYAIRRTSSFSATSVSMMGRQWLCPAPAGITFYSLLAACGVRMSLRVSSSSHFVVASRSGHIQGMCLARPTGTRMVARAGPPSRPPGLRNPPHQWHEELPPTLHPLRENTVPQIFGHAKASAACRNS